MNLKDDFRNIFDFTLLFLQALFKRWVNNKLKVIQVIFTSYILLYSPLYYYTDFNKRLWDHGNNNPWEKSWTSNTKAEWWLVSSGRLRSIGNMHFFCPVKLMLWIRNFFLYLAEIPFIEVNSKVDSVRSII